MVNGRVAGLLDLGAGFDPLLTGRENILAGAAVHRIPQGVVQERMEQIIAFADIGRFIDAPVRTYSNGMLLRLGYAIVAHIDAEVLLVDETLSVGDIGFQRRCASHVRRFVESGGALVFVSHNIWMVKGLCDRGVVLDAGRLTFSGTAEAAVSHYVEAEALPATLEGMIGGADDANQPSPVTIDAVRLEPVATEVLAFGAPARLEVELTSSTPFDAVSWGVVLWTADGAAAVAGNLTEDVDAVALPVGRSQLHATFPNLPVARGNYEVRLVVFDAVTKVLLALHGYEDAGTPFVVSGDEPDPKLTKVGGAPITHVEVSWSAGSSGPP
jgi:lipopolysaccharide transport system ATP-binding protein